MNFEIGATVRLKSGGPLMTVDSIIDPETLPNSVECVWFEAGTRKDAVFRMETLEVAEKGRPR